jgi:hypothetical protein
LRHLLRGSEVEQDVLALLTAARSGLTAEDLTELTAAPLWDIEDVLHTTAGRTFTSRPSWSGCDDRPDIYLLGHEELQVQAQAYFTGRLPAIRDRLHVWAAGYRDRGWPAGTPDYLLSGYYSLLVALGDEPRMIALAPDLARQDRMLDLTGGDVAAIAEARVVLEHIAVRDDPDIDSALAIAYRRDYLVNRNWNIPTSLPAAWAALGQYSRGMFLARSTVELPAHPEILTELAAALASAGRAQDAEAIACLIAGPYEQVSALAGAPARSSARRPSADG